MRLWANDGHRRPLTEPQMEESRKKQKKQIQAQEYEKKKKIKNYLEKSSAISQYRVMRIYVQTWNLAIDKNTSLNDRKLYVIQNGN